jgi:MFS family permease
VIPVLTTIQHDLHTSQSTVTWVLTAYLLSASIMTPILGRVGDMFGKKRVFVGGEVSSRTWRRFLDLHLAGMGTPAT